MQIWSFWLILGCYQDEHFLKFSAKLDGPFLSTGTKKALLNLKLNFNLISTRHRKNACYKKIAPWKHLKPFWGLFYDSYREGSCKVLRHFSPPPVCQMSNILCHAKKKKNKKSLKEKKLKKKRIEKNQATSKKK